MTVKLFRSGNLRKSSLVGKKLLDSPRILSVAMFHLYDRLRVYSVFSSGDGTWLNAPTKLAGGRAEGVYRPV